MFGVVNEVRIEGELNKNGFAFEKAEGKMVVNPFRVRNNLEGMEGKHLGDILGCDILFLPLNQRD